MEHADAMHRDEDDRFIVRFTAWEGPIEAMLDLARSQKLDLLQIDILDLVSQFEKVVGRAMALRLELAADWLVTAAWLAYLKSRILLRRPKDGNSGEPDEDTLAYHLKRLDAVAKAAESLPSRIMLGRDWFAPGAMHGSGMAGKNLAVPLHGLLAAYPRPRQEPEQEEKPLKPFDLASVDGAISRLSHEMPTGEWTDLLSLVPQSSGLRLRSNIATSLVASLEMARNGQAEVRQDGLTEPVYVRRLSHA